MKSLDRLHKETLFRILKLKDQRNLSDRDFGIQSGMGEKAIDNWKRGNSASFMKKLDSIASFFGVTTAYLLGTEQKEKLSTEAESLSDIDREILRIYHSLPESKKKAFMTVARSLKSHPKDK